MIFPDWLGGTMILCVIRVVSLTVPRTSPPETFVPLSAVGTKCHFLDLSMAAGASPLLINGQSSRKEQLVGVGCHRRSGLGFRVQAQLIVACLFFRPSRLVVDR